MRICVYGSASTAIDKKYTEPVEDLCEKLALRGHNLVFGAGNGGVMGAAAKGFRKGGGNVMGVAPDFFSIDSIEEIYPGCDTLVKTDSMGTRKSVMEANADAFIAGPGGIGTYDELFQIMTLKQLQVFDKPIIVFNVAGSYDGFSAQFLHAMENKFLRTNTPTLFRVLDETQTEELIDYLESYDHDYSKHVGKVSDLSYGFSTEQ